MFTRADKGNITVAMDKLDYTNKMNDLLDDSNTYTIVPRNPVNKLITDLHNLLMRWERHGYITTEKYRRLNSLVPVLPRAYGLPKVHKVNHPLRIIVSFINTPLYDLATFIHDIIHKSIPSPKSQVINSFHLIERLHNVKVEKDLELVSLDVISLFTNIPHNLAIDGIKKRWNFISVNTNIPLDEFIMALNLIFNSSYFTFNNTIYKQTFGTPTSALGSPLSPILADIVLQDLEAKALSDLSFSVPI